MQLKRVVVIKDAIAKADVFRVETVGGKIDFGDVGPFAGVKAHRAGFARSVENASAQIEGAEVAAGVADGDDFAVCRRIVVRCDPVMNGELPLSIDCLLSSMAFLRFFS